VSVRPRTRADGTTYWQVRFRFGGRESSVSYNDPAEAHRFDKLVRQVGPLKALEVAQIATAADLATTTADWLTHHNDHLTGVDAGTLARYRSYASRDIIPVLGEIPLRALGPDEIARWVNGLVGDDGEPLSGKTISNKHGYLAGALNAAVRRGLIAANPCDQTRLPRWDRQEMTFLEPAEYALLHAAVPPYWQPLVDFLTTSGARWSEATALRPRDVDPKAGTVRISHAWKTGAGGYRLGVPKTRKSVRTINVPGEVLDKLDYSREWLFTNSGRGRAGDDGPVRIHSFSPNVWHPAVQRAREAGLAKSPRIHDLRHTCASWMVLAGVPMNVVQQHLGHESITTTIGTYTHIDRRTGAEAADVIGRILAGGTMSAARADD
jgi:integrase